MFRFTIRDLLWLTVVVAVSVAWWTSRQRVIALEKHVEDLKWTEDRRGLEQEFYLKRIYELERTARTESPWVQKAKPADNSN
jgi:hypothetical protein